MHSCTPSSSATFAATDFRLKYSWMRAEKRVIAKATGNTQMAASAMRQSKKKRQIPIRAVEMSEPASPGT